MPMAEWPHSNRRILKARRSIPNSKTSSGSFLEPVTQDVVQKTLKITQFVNKDFLFNHKESEYRVGITCKDFKTTICSPESNISFQDKTENRCITSFNPSPLFENSTYKKINSNGEDSFNTNSKETSGYFKEIQFSKKHFKKDICIKNKQNPTRFVENTLFFTDELKTLVAKHSIRVTSETKFSSIYKENNFSTQTISCSEQRTNSLELFGKCPTSNDPTPISQQNHVKTQVNIIASHRVQLLSNSEGRIIQNTAPLSRALLEIIQEHRSCWWNEDSDISRNQCKSTSHRMTWVGGENGQVLKSEIVNPDKVDEKNLQSCVTCKRSCGCVNPNIAILDKGNRYRGNKVYSQNALKNCEHVNSCESDYGAQRAFFKWKIRKPLSWNASNSSSEELEEVLKKRNSWWRHFDAESDLDDSESSLDGSYRGHSSDTEDSSCSEEDSFQPSYSRTFPPPTSSRIFSDSPDLKTPFQIAFRNRLLSSDLAPNLDPSFVKDFGFVAFVLQALECLIQCSSEIRE